MEKANFSFYTDTNWGSDSKTNSSSKAALRSRTPLLPLCAHVKPLCSPTECTCAGRVLCPCPLLSPLMSLCTIMLLWRYETPSRICRVYFRVTFSVRAPYAFSWSFTDPCQKANGRNRQRRDKALILQCAHSTPTSPGCYTPSWPSNELWPLLKPFWEASLSILP